MPCDGSFIAGLLIGGDCNSSSLAVLYHLAGRKERICSYISDQVLKLLYSSPGLCKYQINIKNIDTTVN